MKMSHTHIIAGIAGAVGVVAVAGGVLFLTQVKADRSLASTLAAKDVLLYVSQPTDDMLKDIASHAPSLPPVPQNFGQPTAAAIVRQANGESTWVVEQENRTTPNEGPTGPHLSDDPTYRSLRWGYDAPWTYIAYPTVDASESPLAQMFALKTPIALQRSGTGLTLRFPVHGMLPPQRLSPRPLIALSNASLTLELPPWHAFDMLGELLNPSARLIVESLARTTVTDLAGDMSLPYELAGLFTGPSRFQSAPDDQGDSFIAWEGRGPNSSDTERILTLAHERVGSAHGDAEVKSISTQGYTLNTISRAENSGTEEAQSGDWHVRKTAAGQTTFLSAEQQARFALTTSEKSFTDRTADDTPLADQDGAYRMTLQWTPETAAQITPLWPTLAPSGSDIEATLRGGNGFVELTIGPIEAF